MMEMEKKSLFWGHACRASIFCAAIFGILPTAASAAEAVPDWVYEAVGQLDAQGYVDLAGKMPQECSREELVRIVAQGLHEVDRIQQGTLADEYGRLSSLAVRDEVHVKLYREQERLAKRALADAEAAAKQAEERLVRESLRGTNRLEVMQPLQEKASKARLRLQFAARDYALATMRREKRELALAKVSERRQEVFSRMTPREGAVQADAAACAPASPVAVAVPAAPDSIPAGVGGAYSYGEPLVEPGVMDEAMRLRAAFAEDLALMGYADEENAEQQLYSSVLLPEKPEPRLKVDAEVRADASRSGGIERGDSRARLRLRVFPDYDIDGNWHAAGMIEYEKYLNGGTDDGKLRLDRYYLTGRSGVFDTTVGVFSADFAEGNIYDSKFRGLRLSVGNPVRYTLHYGKIERAHEVTALSASYDTPFYGVDAGMYRFDKINGAARNIYMGNFRAPLGDFDFGAMLLHGTDHRAGNGTGYVLTLAKKGDGWRPGSMSYWLKYYRQPSATYVSHTMNGMADYMSYDATGDGPRRGGFRGWGAGLSYTLQKDLMFGLEYYDLFDLDTARRSRTVWASLTGYFKNYED